MLLPVPGMSDSNRECQDISHIKRQQSLTEEEREFYLDQMLKERDSTKEKSQGREKGR